MFEKELIAPFDFFRTVGKFSFALESISERFPNLSILFGKWKVGKCNSLLPVTSGLEVPKGKQQLGWKNDSFFCQKYGLEKRQK